MGEMKIRRFPPFRLWCLAAMLLAGPAALAQQEDSLRVQPLDVFFPQPSQPLQAPALLAPPSAELPALPMPSRQLPPPSFLLRNAMALPYAVNPSPMFRGDYSTGGVIGRVGGGYFTASGAQTTVPGIGRYNVAEVGYQRQLNERLHLSLTVGAIKMNAAHFTGQSFGTSGMLYYQAQDRLYFRAFGSVDYGNFGGFTSYSYGGTMGFDVTDRFGMELGVERYYNPAMGRWETRPIVTPYYNFDHFKLQIDVGPIIYEVIRGLIQKDDHRRGGPTIMPDVPGFRH